ncbi:MAG TPA: hypothetical protein DET46_15190 [Comamonadaceae bacterium]|nr:hypothetical protein [Comamonadaceae bacterium]
MLLRHDLRLAAGSLGALRRFLAGQPQRNGHFDLPFALALVGVKAVTRCAQRQRGRSRRQAAGSFDAGCGLRAACAARQSLGVQ